MLATMQTERFYFASVSAATIPLAFIAKQLESTHLTTMLGATGFRVRGPSGPWAPWALHGRPTMDAAHSIVVTMQMISMAIRYAARLLLRKTDEHN